MPWARRSSYAPTSFGTEETRYPVPIPETQTTVKPADDGYATGKVALEQQLRAAADRLPVTFLRAGAVHGPRTKHPREWYFIKRALDARPVRILAYGGRSRFHTHLRRCPRRRRH